MKRTIPVLLLSCAATANAQTTSASAFDNRWHWEYAFPVWLADVSGTASYPGTPDQVELVIGDAVDDLAFAFAGRVEGRKNQWGFGLDLRFSELGGEITTGPIPGVGEAEADLEQTVFETLAFYRLAVFGGDQANLGFVDLLGGARYSNTRSQISGDPGSKRTLDWLDVLGGVRGYAGLGRSWGVRGRADLATLGSNLTWTLEGSIAWRVSAQVTLDGGYRFQDVDYDTGSGSGLKVFNVESGGAVFTVRLTP